MMFDKKTGDWVNLVPASEQPSTSRQAGERSRGELNQCTFVPPDFSSSWTNLQTKDVHDVLNKVGESSPVSARRQTIADTNQRLDQVENVFKNIRIGFKKPQNQNQVDQGDGWTRDQRDDCLQPDSSGQLLGNSLEESFHTSHNKSEREFCTGNLYNCMFCCLTQGHISISRDPGKQLSRMRMVS